MAQKRFIFVAPKVREGKHPGGQGTATFTALNYARSMGYALEIVDTTQSSFPVPSFFSRICRGVGRLLSLTRHLIKGDVNGVVIFASSGFSFFERITCSAICRVFGTRDIFFQRSGFFLDEIACSPWHRAVARHLLRIPHRIGAQGDSWRDFYISLGVARSRIVIVRNWLPEIVPIRSTARAYSQDKPIHFVFVGWLVKEKGVNELLDAIERLRPTHRFRLTFVGGGDLEHVVKTRIVHGGWSDSIVACGWTPAEDVIQILDDGDVFVLPSYAEGFPNALLEAMARGLPAICTDVGGVADSLHDAINGFLIPPRDATALSLAMSQYLDDPTLIQRHSTETIRIVAANHDRIANCRLLFSSVSEP